MQIWWSYVCISDHSFLLIPSEMHTCIWDSKLKTFCGSSTESPVFCSAACPHSLCCLKNMLPQIVYTNHESSQTSSQCILETIQVVFLDNCTIHLFYFLSLRNHCPLLLDIFLLRMYIILSSLFFCELQVLFIYYI